MRIILMGKLFQVNICSNQVQDVIKSNLLSHGQNTSWSVFCGNFLRQIYFLLDKWINAMALRVTLFLFDLCSTLFKAFAPS